MKAFQTYRAVTRRDFLKGTILASASLLARRISAPRSNKLPIERLQPRPNIIFIIADDLGYGDLGAYGQQWVQTPCLDEFAAQAMRFTQCYASSTVCAPSRWCLFTGFHTGHAHTTANYGLLHPEDATFAELLRAAGYTTVGIGKWGMGDPGTTGLPNEKGFDRWFGYLNHGHAHTYYPVFLWRNKKIQWICANWECQKQVYSHDLFTEEALDFVRNVQAFPFFLYLAYTIPHTNNELCDLTGNGMEVPNDAPYSGENWPQAEKNFAAMVTRMDRDIGRLVQLLKERGLDHNTIVFVTSDNGPGQGGGHDVTFFNSTGGLRRWKGSLYEGGIRVPMLVRWPGTIPPGVVSDHVWAHWDVFATIADIAGVTARTKADGLSMLPAFLGQPQQDHEHLYWSFLSDLGFSQAVRADRWKAVRPPYTDKVELYDLGQDECEENDVANQYPGIVQTIKPIMAGFGEHHRLYLPRITR